MSTATFTPARHRIYRVQAKRRSMQRSLALAPARGLMIGLGLSFTIWAGLAFLIF